MDSGRTRVSGLLHEAAATHHLVYRIVDEEDPDWASWYADWLINLRVARAPGSETGSKRARAYAGPTGQRLRRPSSCWQVGGLLRGEARRALRPDAARRGREGRQGGTPALPDEDA
jgi:hypothetical protein